LTKQKLSEPIFGNEFVSIIDIEVRPDGYLYVVSYGHEALYRIAPGGNLE
jgi:hypothetical protein